MARDGLIPEGICKVHSKFGTPHIATIFVGHNDCPDRRLHADRHRR